MQAMTFLYGYLAAAVAQGVLSDLRTRLFAHLQRLPASYFDRVPIGDVISRCTADVDTLDTVFSSGVALLLANLVRLVTIAVAMVALSPALSLIAALIAAPLVLVTRALQVRVRQAERESRVAIGAVNTRLQEDLRGVEVIRAFGREPEFIAGFRQVLSRGLAAFNRSSFYSALYTPMTAILSAIAVAALLAAGTQQAFGATSISLGTLTAFLLLLQRFFQPITALGEEWQTVQGAMAGAERIFDTLALRARRGLGSGAGSDRPCAVDVVGRAQRRRLRIRGGTAGSARSVAAGEGRRACRAGGADGRREDERAPSDRGPVPAVGGPRPRGRPRPRAARAKPSATACWVWFPRWSCCSRGPCSTT